MTGISNPFKEVPKAIYESIRDKVRGKAICWYCKRERKLCDLYRDYLDRWECVERVECQRIKQENCK